MPRDAGPAPAPPARRRILDGAIELFAADGYGNTSVKAIAARAGVSPGLIYTYFASKDDLLRAIFEEGLRDVWSTLEPRASGGAEEDPVDALEALLRQSFAIVDEHRDLWRLLYALRIQSGVVERLSLELAAWGEAIESELRALCARAGVPDPDVEAKVLFAIVDGANQHRALAPDRYPVEGVVRAVVARYRKGGAA